MHYHTGSSKEQEAERQRYNGTIYPSIRLLACSFSGLLFFIGKYVGYYDDDNIMCVCMFT